MAEALQYSSPCLDEGKLPQSKDLLLMSGSSVDSVHGACSDDDRLISLCCWWLA